MSLPEGFRVVSQPEQQQSQGLPAGFRVVNPQQEQQQPMSKWEAAKQGFGIIKDAVQGDAEFKEAGDYRSYIEKLASQGHYGDTGFFAGGGDAMLKDLMKLGDASTFGNTEDMAAYIQQINPQADIRRDNADNLYVLDIDGKQHYLNPPGLDGQDVIDGAGNAAFYGLGGLGGALAKSFGTLARMGATGLAEGGLNVAAQKMAGRDEIDKGEVATTAGFGALFEGLTPAVSALWRKVKNSGMSNKQAGKQIAAEMGAELTDEQAEQFGYMVRNLDPDVATPESILQHVELNQRPTLGTLSKDQVTLDIEDKMASSGRQSVMRRFQELEEDNRKALQNSIQTRMNTQPGSDQDAAQRLYDSVIGGSERARQAYQAAYRGIDDTAELGTENLKKMPASIQKEFNENSGFYISKELTPATQEGLEKITKFMDDLPDTARQSMDYKIDHSAPVDDGYNAAGHNLAEMFGDDIYGPNAARYFGHGDPDMDQQTIDILQNMAGNPDATVTIYRAVPDGVDKINKGDWVTVNPRYAHEHGASHVGDGYKIIQQDVKASEIFTDANSIHEFGYSPAGGDAASGVPWAKLENERRKLNKLLSQAKDNTDKEGVRKLIKGFDDSLEAAFENELLNGSPDSLENLKGARALYHDYMKKYTQQGKYDRAGGVIEKWIEAGASEDQVANAIINEHGAFRDQSIDMVKRLVGINGKDSPEVEALRDLIVKRVTQKYSDLNIDTSKSADGLLGSLKKSLGGRRSIYNEIFTKEEVDFLGRTVEFLDSIQLTGKFGRSSGTAERLMRWMNQAVSEQMPGSSTINLMKKIGTFFVGGESSPMKLPLQRFAYNPLTALSNQAQATYQQQDDR